MPFFWERKLCASLWKLITLFKITIRAKKYTRVLEFDPSQWLKPFTEFNTQKIIKYRNEDKDTNALHKLMDNAVYGRTMKNLRNRIDAKLESNEKDHLKWTSKPSYMWQIIFDIDLVAIRERKITLSLNKPAYVGMCISDLSKVLMCEFHYDYIINKYMVTTQDYYSLIQIVW